MSENDSLYKQFSNMNQEGKIDLYKLNGFEPSIINQTYLDSIGVGIKPDIATVRKLTAGSEIFIQRYHDKTLGSDRYIETQIALDEPMEIHDYTGHCPTNTFEVNPIKNACHVGCLYCLVNDGRHYQQDIHIFTNYDEYLRNHLSKQVNSNVFYYFSPKSEAFQEPTLETGIAHKILKEFIDHYNRNPDSKVRLFIATKAGTKQLFYSYHGITIIELLEALKGKVQFNISIGIMPFPIYDLLEPNAASVTDRLKASLLCQEAGIASNSVLTQPIIGSFLTEKTVDEYFKIMASHNIINFKPEFLTVCMENLAILAQLVGWHDKKMEKDILEMYISPENQGHVKQRERTAPNRDWSYKTIHFLAKKAEQYGISASICYWVRKELEINEDLIPIINRNGFQCLGYQMKLFEA